MDTNNVSVKHTPDCISCESIVKEADFSAASFELNDENCSKQLTSFEMEATRLNLGFVTSSDELYIEKDSGPKVSETSDDNNKVSVKCTLDIACEQKVKEADISAFSFGVNAETCSKQLLSFENEVKPLNFGSVSYVFELEKELRDAKQMYYNELCDFMRTTQRYAQKEKQKCEIKKDIYGSFDKIINGLKSQVEVCKDIIPLAQTIYDTLVKLNNNQIKHYSDCVIIFAEFVNGFVEVNGFGGAHGVIDKVEINDHKSANDIAKDCLQTLALLKERKFNDPFSEKIAAASRMEDETDLLLQQIKVKNAESKVEEERIEVEINNREQNIKQLEMEIEKMKQQTIAIEGDEKAKLVKLIYSNMEKTTSYIAMGKKIDEFKKKLGKLPAIEKTHDEVKKRLETSEEKLVYLKNEIENLKFLCKSKKAHIAKYEREKAVFNGSNYAHKLLLMRKCLAPYMLSFFDSVTMEIHKISDDNQQTNLITSYRNDHNNVVLQSVYKKRMEFFSKMLHSFNMVMYFDPELIGIISSRSSPTIFVQDCVLARSAMRIIPTASCTKRRYDLKDQFIKSSDEAYDKVDNSKQENISLSLVTAGSAETVEHLVYSNVEPITSATSREDKNSIEDFPLSSLTNIIELEKQVLIQNESIISFDEETNKEPDQYFVTDHEPQTDAGRYSELNFYKYKIENLNEFIFEQIIFEIVKGKFGFRFGNQQIDFTESEKIEETDNDEQINPIEFIEKHKKMNYNEKSHASGIKFQINKEKYCLFKNNSRYIYSIIQMESGFTFSYKEKFEYCNSLNFIKYYLVNL